MINLKRKKHDPMIPMASMSDIGFLLLIFIMLISLINERHEAKIEYSEAMVVEKTQQEKNIEIWVERDGTIDVDGKIIAPDALEQLIAGMLAEEPSARVHVIADRNTPYRNVDRVIKVLQTLQHRVVSFVVKERA